jgi:hypothetical protein
VRRAAVLPLVTAQQVDNVWLNALVDNDDNSIQTIKFKDYVTETWVEGSIQGWNEFDNDGARTTNHIEGWHSKVNKVKPAFTSQHLCYCKTSTERTSSK